MAPPTGSKPAPKTTTAKPANTTGKARPTKPAVYSAAAERAQREEAQRQQQAALQGAEARAAAAEEQVAATQEKVDELAAELRTSTEREAAQAMSANDEPIEVDDDLLD